MASMKKRRCSECDKAFGLVRYTDSPEESGKCVACDERFVAEDPKK